MSTIYSEKLFARHEADFRPFLAQVGLPDTIFQRPDIEIPIEKYMELLEAVAEASKPEIGLAMGERLRPADLGVYGHAMAATRDVAELLRVMAQYLYVFAQQNVIRVDTAERRTVVSYRHTGPQQLGAIHDVEFATAAILVVIRQLTGKQLVPLSVEFAHPKPEYAAHYARFFGCEAGFGRSGNRIHLDNRMLDLPVMSSDPGLLSALEFSMAEKLKVRSDEDDLVTRVNHLITVHLGEGDAQVGQIASALGLSRRSLQRKLADEGRQFGEMVDANRYAVAMDYIQHSEYSLTDIAIMLGYSELSSFSRAFRRWTGKSPQSFR